MKEAVVHRPEAEPGRFLFHSNQVLATPPQVCVSVSVAPGRARAFLPLTAGLTALEGGLRGREGWLERGEKEKAKGRLSQQKERKATQMLAIVLGEDSLSLSLHLTLSLSNSLSPIVLGEEDSLSLSIELSRSPIILGVEDSLSLSPSKSLSLSLTLFLSLP